MTDDGTFTGLPTGDTAEPTGCPDPFAGGEFLEVVPFTGEPPSSFGDLQGQGWDARLVYDLQRAEEHGGVTPNELFYVRTAYPDLLTTSEADWVIRVDGLVTSEVTLPLADLVSLSADQGLVMMECSGNTENRSFGLMSAARWGGVPVVDVLDRFVDLDPAATRIEIAGFDEHSVPSRNNHSTPGRLLGLHARGARRIRRVLRVHDEREPAVARSWVSDSADGASMVGLCVHQVGRSHAPGRR